MFNIVSLASSARATLARQTCRIAHRYACAAAIISASIAPPALAQDSSLATAPTSIPAASRDAASRIITAATSDSAAWQRMALWTDTFGHRQAGSAALEHAIDWALDALKRDGFQNAHGEQAMVPHWVRGEESATLVSPRKLSLHMLGLGGSVGTPAQGITAPVLVVSTFDELTRRAGEAKGKIVLFDAPFTDYGKTVAYRYGAASAGAKVGAVASLIRSIASGSMQSPHTGTMRYDSTTGKIPVAALSVEDAMLLHRMFDRGDSVVVTLKMAAQTFPDVPSRNVVAEIVGRERPDEVVVIGGHVDSWDVGQGAMDDAGGFITAWEALKVIKRLGLTPRRTIRLVGWTSEESGLQGAKAYRDAHANSLANHVLVIESDGGVFKPTGAEFSGDSASLPVLREIAALLAPIGATTVAMGGSPPDASPLAARGVPALGPIVEDSRYFWYHHSAADTPDKLDPREMAQCVAWMAVYAYLAAEMPGRVKGAVPASR